MLKELFIHVCILSQQREKNYSVVLLIDGMQTKAEVQTFAVAESSSGEIFSCIVYEILGTGDPVFSTENSFEEIQPHVDSLNALMQSVNSNSGQQSSEPIFSAQFDSLVGRLVCVDLDNS